MKFSSNITSIFQDSGSYIITVPDRATYRHARSNLKNYKSSKPPPSCRDEVATQRQATLDIQENTKEGSVQTDQGLWCSHNNITVLRRIDL